MKLVTGPLGTPLGPASSTIVGRGGLGVVSFGDVYVHFETFFQKIELFLMNHHSFEFVS